MTSNNPADYAQLHISISNVDSSSCLACQPGGEFYESGCKRCVQDGVVFSTDTGVEHSYNIAWSNDNHLYHGDNDCKGKIKFPKIKSNSGDTYWVELIRENDNIHSTIYEDEGFNKKIDSAFFEMCSSPTDLQFLRISNEDGKSFGNGGRILGYIDDISIFEKNSRSLDEIELESVYQENFDNCNSKTCDGLWTLQDPNLFYIDVKNKNFHFDSQITATNDYAHYSLDAPLSNEYWVLRFKIHIDNLEEHPYGKGILNLDPSIRQIILGFPGLIIPILSYFIVKNSPSKPIGFLITLNGSIIFVGLFVSLIISNSTGLLELKQFVFFNSVIIISIIIMIFGILLFKKSKLKTVQK